MDNFKNTKTNVVGIGNNNTFSKDQYAKLVNRLHHMLLFTRQEVDRVKQLFDAAVTGYTDSNPDGQKLKPFEIFELRDQARAKKAKLDECLSKDIEKVEARAKALDIQLELNKKSSEDSND